MERMIPTQSAYRKLLGYQKAEAIYDITFHFCKSYLGIGDRTVDQMIQAARSGKQNIAEGCSASATSSATELKLLNVAKASLQELLIDYEDYLRVREKPQWATNSAEVARVRLLGREHNDAAYWVDVVKGGDDTYAANIAIVLIHQTDYLLMRQLVSLEKSFLENGGFSERMYRMRKERR